MGLLASAFGDDGRVLRERDLQVLLLVNVLPPLGSALVSPLLDSLIGPLGASEASVGLMMSAFSAPGVVVIPLTGVLADRYGRKPVLIGGLVLFGTGGVAIALAEGFAVALALRALQGVGFAGLLPTLITSIGDLYDGTAEAAAQGFRFMCSGLTQTFFPLLAGALVVGAWRYPFLLYGLAFPVALLVHLRLTEPAERAADGTDENGPPGASAADRSTATQIRRVGRLLVQPRVAAIVLARGLPVVAWIGFLAYNSILVVRLYGATPVAAGLFAAFGGLTYAVAASQAGRLTALFERRLSLLVAANVALAAGLVLAATAPSLVVGGIGVTAMGLGFGVTMSLYRSMITGLAPADLRGGLVSVAESYGRLTATLGPVAMGAAIATLRPVVGLLPAVRWTVVGTALFVGVAGVLCLVAADRAPEPVHPEPPAGAGSTARRPND